MRRTAADRAIVAAFVLVVLAVLVILAYPVLYVLVSSVSTRAMRSGLSLIPHKISLDGYRAVLEYRAVWRGYRNSVLYTGVGTAVSLALAVLCAYPLSRPDFYCGKYFTYALIFTMYFGGGMIPTYLLLKKLGLLNTMWSLILPSAVSVYNVMLLRAQFRKIPQELFDAASIDGYGHWRYLAKIAAPMSGETLSVIMLFHIVSYWNSYFNAMIYITDADKLPLANILNDILIKNKSTSLDSSLLGAASAISAAQRMELLDYSLIVVASLPVLVVFMFVCRSLGKEDWGGAVKL